MITLAMGAELRSSPDVVWAALTEPDQIARWRPGVEALLDARGRFPEPEARLRWRCRLQGLPVTLAARVREARRLERLRSELRLGLFRFEETFRLHPADPPGAGTRLGLKIRTASEMALVGDTLDRFAVRRFAADLAAVNLQAIRDWCERGQPAQRALPDLPGLAAGG